MMSSILYTDFYKVHHHEMYPKGLTKVYSNFTPRISRMEGINHVVVFGIQYFVREFLVKRFNETFFNFETGAIEEYRRIMGDSIGPIDTRHLEALYHLGYLPIHLKALPEGTLCPLKTPILTITNTHPDFFWLPNFLETLLSNTLWHPITSATIAYAYRRVLNQYADKTSDMQDFVKFQGHDFSMRGQTSLESAMVSGGAHLTSFLGSDTIPAIPWLEKYYDAKGQIASSVPATEHSIQCFGGQQTEYDTYHRLITETYPTGIVSIVSDTWDYWKVLTQTLPRLKDVIMARPGKLVIRPDSGDPVKILCGDPYSPDCAIRAGSVRVLWDLFGGVVNSKGYKQLDSHIGLIYGDSITLERCREICRQLEVKGFASTNVVFGIGSYTYQYVTRDTFGFAMKATYGIVNDEPMEIFKDPVTDGGVKKSAKGLLCVNEDLSLSECVSERQEQTGMLKTVFINGQTPVNTSLEELRKRIDAYSGYI